MFKVGDIVTISQKGTRWCQLREGNFHGGGNNPYGIEGEVIVVGRWISVEWSNGWANTYREDDLDLISIDLENK